MRGATILRSTLAALAVLGAASLPPCLVLAQGQTKTPGGPGSAVRDTARIFSTGAVAEAAKSLDEVRNDSPERWRVIVQTVDSLGGKQAREVASALGKAENLKGLIVLISKGEKSVWVEPSNAAESAFSKAEQTAVSDAITKRFKKSEFDQGLLDAVAEIRRAGLGFGVRDRAAMFKPDTLEKANASLDSIHKSTKWNVVIETVETLGGKQPRDLAVTNAKALDVRGLYVLIAKKEHKLWAEPSNSAKTVFNSTRIRAIDDAITAAFKSGDFDKGLIDGVAEVRKTADSNVNALAQAKAPVSPPAIVPHLPGPGDPSPSPSPSPSLALSPKAVAATPPPADTVNPPVLPNAPAARLPGPSTAPQPDRLPEAKEGSILPFLLIVGGGTLLFLWFVSRFFKRSTQPGRPEMMAGAYPQQPQQQPQPQPQPYPGVSPGYGPRQPNPGSGPGPAPGYGYGQPQAPLPGYGYGGPPPRQGGGMLSGAIGGLGGAIVGNILYDKFGRAIPNEGAQIHDHAGHVDAQGNAWPQGQSPATGQPAETFDPNAGVGGDWGAAPPDANANANTTNDEGAGGDWGNAEPVDQGGAGGDWGSPDAPAPDAPAETDAGGDWGSGPEPEPDTGGGGDWGGGDAGGNDENQGGGW